MPASPAPGLEDLELAREAERLRRPRGPRALGLSLLLVLSAVGLYVAARSLSLALRPAPARTGDLAPALRLTTLEGAPLGEAELRGKVVLLDFWATWCSGCLAFFPIAERLDQAYRDRGLAWIAVHTLPAEASEVRAFLEARGSGLTAVLDPGGLAEAFGIYSTPSYVLIDRRGRVRAVHHHMASGPQLEKGIEALLEEQ